MKALRNKHSLIQRQQGAAFIVMLVILIMGVTAFLVSSLNSSALQTQRDKVTADALAQAKEALIGFAANVQIGSSNAPNQPRPGELPCPDNHPSGDPNEGSPSASCNGGAIGRLPWKKLGLPDLRDSSGERLWYAVSSNFKNDPRTGVLNSDTTGTITVRDSMGNVVFDGTSSSGAVAIIMAPGEPLTRYDNLQQNRIAANYNDPRHYLDCLGNTPSVCNIEDNANFADSSPTDGLIQGRIRNSRGDIVLNDQLLVITQDNIMQPVQKRVAGEVRNCLADYALNNYNRYPWAAPISDLNATTNDVSATYFGRIPDNLSATESDIDLPTSDMWGAACNTHTNNTPATWWTNWKEIVFYGLAKQFRPSNSISPIFPATCATAGNCLNINSTATPARFVVIVAGKRLSVPFDQANRSANKGDANYYLEAGNQNAVQSGGYTFSKNQPSSTFNDTVVSQ